jgi:hypothetical protein
MQSQQGFEYDEYLQGNGKQDGLSNRAAGQRSADFSYPEFGPVELVEEINCNMPHKFTFDWGNVPLL